MKLLSHADDKVTIEFTLHELHLANALIQEGPISHEGDSPGGQAVGHGIRSIAIRVEEAAKSGLEFGGTH